MRDITDIISPILWALLTAGVAIALTLSALAMRPNLRLDAPTKLAVDCYALMEASWAAPQDSAEREASYDALDERGCWP